MIKAPLPRVGIDSQCLSYLLDAIAGIEEPTDLLAEERKALIRIWFYTPEVYYVTETVLEEVEAIKSMERREFHKSFINSLFLDIPVRDCACVEARASSLSALHSGSKDCRILAEAEDQDLEHLLTYDNNFLKRLATTSKSVQVLKPSAYWTALRIIKGARPETVPHHTNPLSKQNWWRWE